MSTMMDPAEALTIVCGELSTQCCEEDEKGDTCSCPDVATCEVEQLKTGQKWLYCARHAPAKADLPPRVAMREYQIGEALRALSFLNAEKERLQERVRVLEFEIRQRDDHETRGPL